MKRLIVLCLIYYLVFPVSSQEFQKVDKVVDKYPDSFSKPEKLAEMINKDFKSEKDKARAIYRWIALHIKYDVDAYYSGQKSISYSYSSEEEKKRKEKEMELKVIEQTLKKKKAVCEGYASLYKYLCDQVNVECVIIQGYSKIMYQDIGKMPKNIDHSWNAVKLKSKWELIDVTWGAGFVDYARKVFVPKYTDTYFLTDPSKFYQKHYPEKKDWLFVDKSLQDFVDQPLYYTETSNLDISLIKPQKGILKVKNKEKVEFKWKTNLDIKKLSYAFKGDKYGREISATNKDGALSFEITIDKASAGYLTFFYEGVSVLTYKIEAK